MLARAPPAGRSALDLRGRVVSQRDGSI